MTTIAEAVALKDSAGLEAAVDALATLCKDPVPAGTVGQRLVAIAAQHGVTFVVGPSGDIRTPEQVPVEPHELFAALAAQLEDQADHEPPFDVPFTTDDVEGGPTAHSEPEAPAPGSPHFTEGN